MATKKKSAAKEGGKKTGRSGSSRPKAPVRPQHSEAYEKLLGEFSAALGLLRKGDHAKALEAFRAIDAACREEPVLGQRCRTYAALCERRLAPDPEVPSNHEARYRAAVGMVNDGNYEGAMTLLEQAIAENPAEATYLYARASVHALTGAAERAAEDLRKAIAGKPELRFQAVNDPDFDAVRDQASFIDVIEPTPSGA